MQELDPFWSADPAAAGAAWAKEALSAVVSTIIYNKNDKKSGI